MADIAALLFPFFGLIFIGYLAGRITKQPVEALGWLNTFIIYAALPALFFKLISKTPIEQLARLDFVAFGLMSTYSVFLLMFLIGYFIRRNSFADCTIQGFAGSYGNVGYMGPGIALMAFGEQAAVPVALIVCLENATHFITAPALMAVAGGDKRSPLRLAGDVTRKVLTHPFIVSVIVAFTAAFIGWKPPQPVQQLVDYLAQSAAPCALFAMGVTLALRPLKRVPVEIGYIVPAKLLLHPLLTFTILSYVGTFDPVWVATAVLLAALPAATNVFVIAQQYHAWQERASATVLISTVLSVFSVSVVLYFIHSMIV